MKSIDKIITESINKLLVEEFGIIYDLEPFGDFILEEFFNEILRDCMSRNKYEIDVNETLSMNAIKSKVNCKNWYGIDNIETIILKTSFGADSEASVEFDDEGELLPAIVFNLGEGFTKEELCAFINNFGKEKAFKKFYATYKPSVMHELTHLIEIAKTWPKYKYPAYAYMSDSEYEDKENLEIVKNISFAFSKTEMNARVTTFYYTIINSADLISKVKTWNGKKGELCKSLINMTSNYNWVNSMKRCLFIIKRAAMKGEKPDIDLVKNFIEINRMAAYSGSKNLFGIKWKEGQDSYEYDIINAAWDLYDKMYKMYNSYLRKLYRAADLAIDKVKNEQAQ